MPHALLLLGRQLAGTLVEHRSLAPSPPWAGRDGEGRSGSKVAKGAVGGQLPAAAARLTSTGCHAKHQRVVR